MKLFNHIALIMVSCTSLMCIAADRDIQPEEVRQGATIIVRAENNETMNLNTEDLRILQSQPLIHAANQLLPLPSEERSLLPLEERSYNIDPLFNVPVITTLVPLKALLLQIDLQQIQIDTIREIIALADYLIINPYGQLFNFFQQLAKENMPLLCEFYKQHLIEDTGYLDEIFLPYQPYNKIKRLGRVSTEDATQGHTNQVTTLDISKDSNTIISGSGDSTIIIWQKNPENGRWRWRRLGVVNNQVDTRGHTDWINTVVLSEDTNTIFSGSQDFSIIVWQQHSQTEAWPFYRLEQRHNDAVTSLSLSKDNNTLISGSLDTSLIVWQKNPQTSQWQFKQLLGAARNRDIAQGHVGPVTAIAISKDGNTIVSGSWDNTLIIWRKNPENDAWYLHQRLGEIIGEEDPENGHIRTVTSVALSDDDQTIISGSEDHTVIVWHIDPEAEQWRPQQRLTPELNRDPEQGHTNWVTSVDISKDGRTIISGSLDNTIIVWHKNPQTEEWYKLTRLGALSNNNHRIGHIGRVNAVRFSDGSDTIISGGDDNTIIIWQRKSITNFCNAVTTQGIKKPAEEAPASEPPAKEVRTQTHRLRLEQ